MIITHFTHSALQVDYPDARIILDPGNFSDPAVADVTGVHIIAVTHQHPDHVTPENLARLAANNPEAAILLEPQTHAALVAEESLAEFRSRFTLTAPGFDEHIAGVRVRTVGGEHAVIHPDIARVGNCGFLFSVEGEPAFGHTGDSLEAVEEWQGVNVLSFPVCAPWSKLWETIDFLREVKPRFALPVHDAIASNEGRGLFLKQTTALAPEGTDVLAWPEDRRREFLPDAF